MLFSTLLLATIASTLVSAATNCTVASQYTVQSGDTLTAIATKYNVTLVALESVNDQIPDFNVIEVNQTINIPNHGCNYNPCPIVLDYTVKSGDESSTIAARFNISLSALESVNPQIANFNFLEANVTVLHIPATTCIDNDPPIAYANCVETTNTTYTVVKGDTFFVISASKLQVTLASLEAANPQIADYNKIEVGQVINVPVCTKCVDKSYGSGVYNVVKGDTFHIIASEKLNITLADFEDANPQVASSNFTEIEVDQVLSVPLCSRSCNEPSARKHRGPVRPRLTAWPRVV